MLKQKLNQEDDISKQNLFQVLKIVSLSYKYRYKFSTGCLQNPTESVILTINDKDPEPEIISKIIIHKHVK